jgi:hypothetical protein
MASLLHCCFTAVCLLAADVWSFGASEAFNSQPHVTAT